MNTKINYQLQGKVKQPPLGDLETDVSSFSPSSESIIRFNLTKGKSSKRRSLNLPMVLFTFLNSRLIIYFGVSLSHRSSTPFRLKVNSLAFENLNTSENSQ